MKIRPFKFQVPKKDKEYSLLRKQRIFKVSKKQRLSSWKFDKARKIFLEWMNKNIHRFNTKPILQPNGSYVFKGIISNVKLYVNSSPEAMIYFTHTNDSFFDMVDIDYITTESYNSQKGFYDADRTDGVFTYFSTREELYINEVYEKIIEYCNKFITQDYSLYLIEGAGWNMGFIGLYEDEFQQGFKSDEIAYKVLKYDLFNPKSKPFVLDMREMKNE